MTRINTGRVIAGGLLAGLLFNIGDFLTNTYILAADFESNLKRLGLDPAAMQTTESIA
jgi:hypothetical protein